MQKLKIAVIGCGHWGKNLVRNFFELGMLKYVCDANTAHAQEIARKYSVEEKSIAEILKTDIDGVVIAAPAEQHYDIAKASLEAGKHVFVEKPLSLKINEAEKLCELSATQNKILMVGHLLQYHPAFVKLEEFVKRGKLGKLQYIYSNRLNLGKFRTQENILWSFAPHDISMILSLAGDVPQSVLATGAAHLNPHIYDVTTTHLTFKNGIRAHVFVSWLHPFKEQKLVVVGDRGMAVFDDGLDWSEKLKLYPHQVNWVNGLPQPQKAEFEAISLNSQEPLKAECEHFLDCIKHKSMPRTDSLEGLNVLKVLDASQQSLTKGVTVHLENNNKIEKKQYYVHETACVDEGCTVGKETKVWHYSHILKGTKVGANCTVGQNVMLGPDVVVGNNCKIQNNVSLYKGVTLEDGVFCGPSCVFTNVHNPRAEVERKDEFRLTHVEKGVTIGANATIICGNKLGAYSLIGAGAVITKDVKPHAVMVGNPAKQIGWVSHAGEKLDESLKCSREGRQYAIDQNGNLKEVMKRDSNIKEIA
ncbi:MAG: Gfo/Idh/MocA family oxidoreductase [Alphaproteobacteria bacterium]|nr:MAG: Gfo/Idh/MocA family oxidoreductase [Alphaproteobacteria bacterium]